MRKDAEQHRDKLIAAATSVFTTHGCEVPLETVLLEADVGRGTLYRHFKTRADLVFAVMDRELERSEAFVAARAASPTPLRDFLGAFAQVGILAASAIKAFGDEDALALLRPLHERASAMYDQVIQGALSSGEIRPPFDVSDLMLLMRMVIAAGHQDAPGEGRQHLIERGVSIIFDGLAGSIAAHLKNTG